MKKRGLKNSEILSLLPILNYRKGRKKGGKIKKNIFSQTGWGGIKTNGKEFRNRNSAVKKKILYLEVTLKL